MRVLEYSHFYTHAHTRTRIMDTHYYYIIYIGTKREHKIYIFNIS